MDSDGALRPAQFDQVDLAVRRLVGVFAPEPVALVDPATTLLDELAFNSLRLIELAFVLEEIFEMEASTMGEMAPAGTVADVRDFVLEKVSTGEARVPPASVVDELIEQERDRNVG